MWETKRLTLFSGHYGSGKTNIALNWAGMLKARFDRVAVADIDVVNPYFRSSDSRKALESQGIRLICSPFAGSNVDLPALPGEVYALTDDRGLHAVIDIGGDERGALALGRWRDKILEENDYEMLLVVSFLRPLTRDSQDALSVAREIESACRMRFTGIVNNTNLGAETTAELVLRSDQKAQELSRLMGIPLRMTCVDQALFPALSGKIPNLFPLTLQGRY